MNVITREEAIAISSPHYFTGEPCGNGHISKRRTRTRHCLACVRDAMVEYRNRHPEKSKMQEASYRAKNPNKRWQQRKNASVRWRKNNPEKVAETLRVWVKKNANHIKIKRRAAYEANKPYYYERSKAQREANPAKARQAVKDWELRNPEKAKRIRRASGANRRARKALNGGHSTGRDIEALFLRYNNQCVVCPSTKRLHVDHILAIARGGSNDPSNLQILCHACNISKGDKIFEEWLPKRKHRLGLS